MVELKIMRRVAKKTMVYITVLVDLKESMELQTLQALASLTNVII